jgi:hypothetical protein
MKVARKRHFVVDRVMPVYCILARTFAISDGTSFDLRAISTASSRFAE